jgi:ABC-type phosphate transport system substrate-binding protein
LKKPFLNSAVRIGWIAALLAMSMPIRVALADAVVVVSAKSPVKSLTANQVLDIFLGRSARFPSGSRAVPIDQQEGAAARNDFYTKLSGKSGAQLKAYWSKIIFTGRGQPPTAVADGYEVKRTLAANPAAIGYIDRSLVDDSVIVVLQGY